MLDYKKAIKSRAVRGKILEALSFVPDKPMIKLQYWIKTGRRLNLSSPQRFTEKLQWMKLYYRDPLMVQCVDKYDVRDYIRGLGLEDTLVKCYGVFDNASDVNFDVLPERFVIKDTLGGGGNSVIICTNKSQLDLFQVRQQIEQWTNVDGYRRGGGREWPYYSGKKHRIIIEEYIESDATQGGLIDYKFMCFQGKPEIIYVLTDRKVGFGAGCGIFNLSFEKIPCLELDETPLNREIQIPENLTEMITYASKVSKPFPEARIDIYSVGGKIYFGEITFFDSSGYQIFDPDEFDFELGSKFILPKKQEDNRNLLL